MSKVYGYVRISTRKQNLERQERNILAKYPKAIIVKETYTGTTTERPRFMNLLKKLKADDVLVFDSVSRMSRNAIEGFQLYKELYNKGIELVFLKEPSINSECYKVAMGNKIEMTNTDLDIVLEALNVYIQKLMEKQFFNAFEQSEKEVMDLRQRTKEGLKTAKANGSQVGLPKGTKLETKKAKVAKELIKKHNQCWNGTLNDIETMNLIKGQIGKLSANTYYKYKKELKLEEELESKEKLDKLGIMQGQVDVEELVKDDNEAELEEIVKVTKTTAQNGAVDNSNITSDKDVVEEKLCKTSSKEKVKAKKKQPKSTKTVDKDYDMGEIAKALEEDNKPKDPRMESLRDMCLRDFLAQDTITFSRLQKWLNTKETQRVKAYWNCKDDELANLLLELNINVKAERKLVKHFYLKENKLYYW